MLFKAMGSGHCELLLLITAPLPSARQHPSYADCLEVKREYYQNCSVLDCVTQCSQSAAHLYEQYLQVQPIEFVTLAPLCHVWRQCQIPSPPLDNIRVMVIVWLDSGG